MALSKPLRWGILGTARINRSLIGPLRSSKKSTLKAVASRSPEKAREYARSWNIPYSHSSYEDLLADPEIDVIYNSLPNSLHVEWSIKAMQNGKHVLCEKPLSTKSTDVDALINISRQTGMIVTEAFMYRHHPQTTLIKQIVENGEIGDLQLIRGSFCYINNRSGNPRFDPDLGGGSLWDVGCYPVGYARYLTEQEPIEVYGHQAIGATGVDVLFAGQMQFPGGVITQFECSFITPFRALMEITGDKGRITIPEPYKPGKRTRIYLEREGQTRSMWVKGADLYLGEVEDLENAILNGTVPLISLAESKANILAIEALYKSAQLSHPVYLQNNMRIIME